jgi:hypothetical protein
MSRVKPILLSLIFSPILLSSVAVALPGGATAQFVEPANNHACLKKRRPYDWHVSRNTSPLAPDLEGLLTNTA